MKAIQLITASNIIQTTIDGAVVDMATSYVRPRKCPYARINGSQIMFGDTAFAGNITMENSPGLKRELFVTTQKAMFTGKAKSKHFTVNRDGNQITVTHNNATATFPAKRMQLIRLNLAIMAAEQTAAALATASA